MNATVYCECSHRDHKDLEHFKPYDPARLAITPKHAFGAKLRGRMVQTDGQVLCEHCAREHHRIGGAPANAALARAMSDRDAAARALGDLIIATPLEHLPEHLHTAAQEYADLAVLEDLAYAASTDPELAKVVAA